MSSHPVNSRMADDIEWALARDALIQTRANCDAMLEEIIRGLNILAEAGPSSYGYRKSAELYNWVLTPLRDGDFDAAWSGIIRFIEDPIMARIMTRLLRHVEPSIAVLTLAKADFELS